MDVDEPRSLFIAVSHDQYAFPYPVSIIRLDSSPPNPNHPHKGQSFEIDSVAHLSRPPHPPNDELYISWGFVLPPATSPENLYIFPDCSHGKIFCGTLPFIIFNSSTKNCTTIEAPPYSIELPYSAVAATMGDRIYFLTISGNFVCYHTILQSWEKLVPLKPYYGWLGGSAVLDDSILFSFRTSSSWVYNVNREKWYAVKDSKRLCPNIFGEAVVIDNIIYALKKGSHQSLVTFCINRRDKDDGDLEYTCDLIMEYEVPGMAKGREEEDIDDCRHLVHFGKNKFCVVSNWCVQEKSIQNIRVTCIELSETKSSVNVIYTCVHGFKIHPRDLMLIRSCFSLPSNRKSKSSNALKQGTRLTNLEDEAEAEIVTLPPELFLEKYRAFSKQDSHSYNPFESFIGHQDTTPQVREDVPKKSSASVVAAKSNVPTKASKSRTLVSAVSGRGNTKGHSVYVRNLQPDFSLIELVESLKKFGPVKDLSIHVDYGYPMSECWLADVEFERAASKQNAVKESFITVGGRYVVIEEKRGTGLTQYRMRGGSSSDRR